MTNYYFPYSLKLMRKYTSFTVVLRIEKAILDWEFIKKHQIAKNISFSQPQMFF